MDKTISYLSGVSLYGLKFGENLLFVYIWQQFYKEKYLWVKQYLYDKIVNWQANSYL